MAADKKLFKTDDELCFICCENKIEVVFYPCRHYVLCNNCKRKAKFEKCPYCSKKIEIIGRFLNVKTTLSNLDKPLLEEAYIYIDLGDSVSKFLRSQSSSTSIFYILQSYLLDCKCIIPFRIVDEKYLGNYSIISSQERLHIIANEGGFWHTDIEYPAGNRKLREEFEQIKTSLFFHDHVIKKKILTDEFFGYEASKFIDDLIISTGSVMAGSYPLSCITEYFYVRDVDIFGYDLSFLRRLLEFLLEKKLKPSVEYTRSNNLDSYKIYFEGSSKDLNFIHLGLQDVVLSARENKEKTMKFILDNFDIMACATCYDGEYVHMSRLTLEKKSYTRYVSGSRHHKYCERGFKLINVPELEEKIRACLGDAYHFYNDSD